MPLLSNLILACFNEMSCGEIITTFLGGLLGFLGAYIMYRIQRKSDREEAEKRDSEVKRATYDFAKEQLLRARKAWKRQIGLIAEFGFRYESEPLNDHPHPVLISPAQRTLDSMDRQEMRLALGHHFGSKGGARVFRSMVAIIDYFDTFGTKTLEGIIAVQQDIYREKVRFDDLQAEVGMAISNTMGLLRAEHGRDHPLYQHLNEILLGLHTHVNGPNYQASPKDFMEYLVTPALELMRNEKYAPAYLANILSAAKRAQQAFRRIKQSAAELAGLSRQSAQSIAWMMRLVNKMVEILTRSAQRK